MTESSDLKWVFVGRKDELDTFHKLLARPGNGVWILNIYGDGGMGKTLLLERFRQIVHDEYPDVFVTPQFVDFYFTSNQHEFGVLRNLASQLGAEHFVPFEEALAHYEERLDKPVPLAPDEQRSLQNAVYDHFVECYQMLAKRQRLVLLLDTAEEAGEATAHLWNSVLPKLRDNTLVVVAGRQKYPPDESNEVLHLPLGAFHAEEAVAYLRQRGFMAEDIADETIQTIWQRTRGRPILVAIAADYLEQHPAQELLDLSEDEFISALAERVCDIGQFENQAILLMAYAWRRFNTEILAHLSGRSVDVCGSTIQQLRRLSFIKYRPPQMGLSESCLLHDEMRDLVQEHIWSNMDRDGMLRHELGGRMVDYYEQTIPNARDWRQRQSLTSEQLYYRLDHDLDEGFADFRRLFEEKSQAYDIGFCEALNAEVGRYQVNLSESYRHELDFRRGWGALRRERHTDAIALWEELAADADVDDWLKARALTNLVEAHTDNSEFARAQERGEQAKELYEIMKQITLKKKEKSKIDQELSLLYNNLGYMFRKQDRWEEAIQYYEQALKIGAPIWQEARIRNNLGYAHHLLGRSELALSHCEMALRIREKLGVPYELGLSYNTLGMLYLDAMHLPAEVESTFQKARVAFEQAHSQRGRALVYTTLGRFYRQWGWYQERRLGEPFNPEREQYRKALEYLLDAVGIYRDVGDEAGLAEALQELACTYRERHEWEEVIDCLDQALELARNRDMHRRETDILQDLSITYWRQGKLEEAEQYARQASEKAREAGFHYLLAKAQWTLGDIAFVRARFDDAFKEYTQACSNITKLDPEAVGHESAKKKLYYDDLVKHIEGKVLQLPGPEQVEAACRALIKGWHNAGLVPKFPGFIERIKGISTRYELLRESEEDASNVQ